MSLSTPDSDLERWLADTAVEWAQVMSARVGLRVLPVGLGHEASAEWFDSFAISLLRAAATSWILRYSIVEANDGARRDAGSRAAADAAFIVRAAARAADQKSPTVSRAADAIANATDAARADAYPDFAARATWQAITDADSIAVVFDSVQKDREWLQQRAFIEKLAPQIIAERLARNPLWLSERDLQEGSAASRSASSQMPEWFEREWESASLKLLESSGTFHVWTTWFDRVVAGHQPTFGETAAAEDYVTSKFLKVSRAFWQQEAAVVNQTIIKWILQVELQDDLLELIDRSRSGGTQDIGMSREMDFRADLLRQLELLARVVPPTHGAIGHNQPPEPAQWRAEIVLLVEIAGQASAAAEELSKPLPNRTVVGEKVSLIGRALDTLMEFAGVSDEKAADALAIAVGTAAAATIASIATFVLSDLLEATVRWLAAMI